MSEDEENVPEEESLEEESVEESSSEEQSVEESSSSEEEEDGEFSSDDDIMEDGTMRPPPPPPLMETPYVRVPYKCGEGEEYKTAIHYGWGWKWSKKFGKSFFVKRIFILTHDGKLYYFKGIKAKKPCKPPVIIKDCKFWRSNIKRNCVQIERYTKPWYFYFSTSNDMLIWMEKLSRAGGVKSNAVYVEEKKPEIALKPVSKWTEANVSDWMDYIPLDGTKTIYHIYLDKFSGVDGPTLLRLKDSHLRKLGIRSYVHRRTIRQSLDLLRSNKGQFDIGFYVVMKKLTEMLEDKFGKLKEDSKIFLAMNLTKPKRMRETYLNLKTFGKSLRMSELIDEGEYAEEEEEDGEDEDTDNNNTDEDSSGEGDGIVIEEEILEEESVEETKVSKKKKKEKEVLKETYEEKENRFLEEKLLEKSSDLSELSVDEYQKEKGRFPVKLVITEVTRSNNYKTARRLLSPVMTMIPTLQQEFGLFHTALIVGPWYLEWNSSSVCIPRQLMSSMALLSADIEFTVGMKQLTLKEVTKRVSEVVCRWNTSKTYRNITKKNEPHLGNCHNFVEDVMESLGLFLKKDGAFGRYMEQMRKNGRASISFMPTSKFQKKFKLSKSAFHFKSHRDLDLFAKKLIEKDETALVNEFKDSYKLLKSFDRAYWLRYMKSPNEKYKPLQDKKMPKVRLGGRRASLMAKCLCPFEDPSNTRSFVQVDF